MWYICGKFQAYHYYEYIQINTLDNTDFIAYTCSY